MRFEFATAARIIFGPGTAKGATAAAAGLGGRTLIVTGSSPERAALLKLDGPSWSVAHEPTVEMIREAVALARAERCDVVVAVGGGSALDAGKAIAALAPNDGDVLRYLEVVGEGKTLDHPALPIVAIPTTAGTGSEVTRNAVLASTEHRVKASLRHTSMLPKVAIVDPELTLSLPRTVTASTGLDAFTQLLEPFVSARATPMTDALCLDGLRRAAKALPRAWRDGGNLDARSEMCLASLYGGIALANAGLGAVHGFAAPVGGMYNAPHGAVCAALLSSVISVNRRALRQRSPENAALGKYAQLDELCGEPVEAFAARLCIEMQVPKLRAYGITAGDVPILCEKAAQASSMKANPIALTAEELAEMLAAAI